MDSSRGLTVSAKLVKSVFVFFYRALSSHAVDTLDFLFILLRQLEHTCVRFSLPVLGLHLCRSRTGMMLLEIKPICVYRWRSGCPQQFLQHLGDHGYFQTPPLHLQPQHRLHLLVSAGLQTVSTHMHVSVTLYRRDRWLQSSRAGFHSGFMSCQVGNSFAERSGTSGECAVHL